MGCTLPGHLMTVDLLSPLEYNQNPESEISICEVMALKRQISRHDIFEENDVSAQNTSQNLKFAISCWFSRLPYHPGGLFSIYSPLIGFLLQWIRQDVSPVPKTSITSQRTCVASTNKPPCLISGWYPAYNTFG